MYTYTIFVTLHLGSVVCRPYTCISRISGGSRRVHWLLCFLSEYNIEEDHQLLEDFISGMPW